METGAQHPGWELLTANEVEVLKKAMPPDEPEVVNELNYAMQTMRYDGNAVSLDEKLSIMLHVLKSIVFLMRSTTPKGNDGVAIVIISAEEERYLLRNLTKFAGFIVRSLSLNDVLKLTKAAVVLIFNLRSGSTEL